MLGRNFIGLLIAGSMLSGCGAGEDLPIIGLTTPAPFEAQPGVDVAQLPDFRLVGWQVQVPETLRVSEANSFKPAGDIVWRGDPFGDRYAQVQAIVEAALDRAAPNVQGDLPVTVQIVIRRFHSVTERTRYTLQGLHEIRYGLQVANAQTGEIIVPLYEVDATFEAYGGYRALDAERRGITQKSRVIERLTQSIILQLTGNLIPLAAELPADADATDEATDDGEGAPS